MKKLTILILLFLVISPSIAQKNSLIPQPAIDDLIKFKIDSFRKQRNLGSLIESEVLRLSSQHHSYYMATTQIVSHYQTMNLVSMSSIYSPRKRVDYFSNKQVPDDINFLEVVVGIKSKARDNNHLADELMHSILNSENLLALINRNVNYLGLSTIKRNNRYFLTIKFAIESNEVFTALE